MLISLDNSTDNEQTYFFLFLNSEQALKLHIQEIWMSV